MLKELEKVLNQWSRKEIKERKGMLHLALDGKTLRARAYNEQPAAHILSLFSTALKRVRLNKAFGMKTCFCDTEDAILVRL